VTVYASVRTRRVLWSQDQAVEARHRWRGISPNVFALGFTSMFTDISSEMVNAVVPIYLTFQLGFGALQISLFTGIYSGIAALTALVGATMSDRLRRHKEVAGAGYSLSALCKLGLLLSRSVWLPATAFLYLDRMGKGARTAPRDALISLSSTEHRLGESFGVHRALDTTGAVLGPLLAFGLLALTPGVFSPIFFVSFCVAIVGVVVLVLFVRPAEVVARARSTPTALPTNRVVLREALGLLRQRRFASVVMAGTLLGVFTIADALVYLTFEHRSAMTLTFFPLLYVGTSVAYLALAVPLGRLADRVGREFVFLGGFGFLALMYVVLLSAGHGALLLLIMLVSFGTYYAATDGVLAAMAAATLPQHLRTTGLALLDGALAGASFLSSLLFGALWAAFGSLVAVKVFLVTLVAAGVVASVLLVTARRHTPATTT
jgi:MFS family permease